MDKNKMIPPKIWEMDCNIADSEIAKKTLNTAQGKINMIHRVKSAYLAVGLCIGTIIQRVLTSQTKKYIQSIADRVDRMNFMESVECVSISMAFIQNRNTRTEYIAHTQKDRKTAVMLCHI